MNDYDETMVRSIKNGFGVDYFYIKNSFISFEIRCDDDKALALFCMSILTCYILSDIFHVGRSM